MTHVRAHRLAGRRFDHLRIDALLAQTDLVVAHNAAFEWPFLTPLFPRLAELPWACSLRDIEWVQEHAVARASIDGLLAAYAMGPSDQTPEGDCHALVRILSQRLPRSLETGFKRLLAASRRVTVCCAGADASDAVAASLEPLGFRSENWGWTATLRDDEAALDLETRVVDGAVDNPAFAGLKMWRVNATTRFEPGDDDAGDYSDP